MIASIDHIVIAERRLNINIFKQNLIYQKRNFIVSMIKREFIDRKLA